MKNLYIALSFVVISITVSAQNKNTKIADKLFARFEYVDAVKEYQKLVENGKADPYVYMQLADANYNMFNSAEAIKWYKKATETQQDAETYYRYAQMLKAEGKYDDANKQMRKFAAAAPSDLRAKAFNENPNYIPSLLDKTKLFDVKSSEISSDKSDFGAVLYDNSLYFASARNGARKNYGWTEEPFLDIYKADYNTDGTITNASPVTELNSKWHDGPITISADGKTAYFASESYKEKQSSPKDKKANAKYSQVYLFSATKNGDSWGTPSSLPFNDKSFSNSNPSLSRDGKTLYFSSNRSGSVGGTDIWKVAVNADGTYGEPQNLGNKVNTEGNESFPFIADDNKTLYFASSGKQGFGGLDVYQIDLTNGEATNLGKPVNTEKDDFAFTFNESKKIGFLSTNRSGNDDIFIVNPICAVDVLIVVTNAKTGEILANASVSILDDKKNVIATQMSNAKGEVSYKVECDRAYVIQASKDGFEGNTFAVTKSKGPKAKVDAALQPIDVIVTETEIILKPIYFEYDKSNITQEGAFELDKLVQVMKNNDKMVILAKSHTDSRGSDKYNLTLSERRAKSTVQYIISKGIDASRISGKGMGELEPKEVCNPCTEAQHALNRRSEFLIVK
jgi:outer membrane protein OmpA-like peptidoglycan-associated protein/tetratricopeptide (TPR) repeat protein